LRKLSLEVVERGKLHAVSIESSWENCYSLAYVKPYVKNWVSLAWHVSPWENCYSSTQRWRDSQNQPKIRRRRP
jgi:hypothetical protein